MTITVKNLEKYLSNWNEDLEVVIKLEDKFFQIKRIEFTPMVNRSETPKIALKLEHIEIKQPTFEG